MSDLILAVDQGTSSTKAVVFDTTGRIVAKAVSPLQSLYPHPGFVEQRPQAILDSVYSAVGMCVAAMTREGRSARDITCAGISNQRETALVWDTSGAPLANAIVWQCKRSTEICRELAGSALDSDIRSRTGLLVDPYFSGTKVMWLYRNEPAVRAAIDENRAMFGTVDTWLMYNLSRGTVYATDRTNASRTLFYNIDTGEWDRDILERLGLARILLPTVQPSAAAFGQSDFAGRLPRPIPITAAVGDSHASAVSQGCTRPGHAKVTLGTGCSMLMNTGARAVSSHGLVSTVCFSTANRVDFALEGIVVSCGATLTWLRDQLGLYRDTHELDDAVRDAPSSGGIVLVPGFAGLGAPYWRMDARGELRGLTFASNRPQILRAALESIAFQVADVIGAMGADAGEQVHEIAADGGISSNRFVMQLIADTLGTRVVNRGIEEGSALGAACLAALGQGIFGSLDDLNTLACDPDEYTPGGGREQALAGHAAWRKELSHM